MYYHGSPTLIKKDKTGVRHLEPRPSRVVNGEEVVFATPNKYWALYFAAPTKDSDIMSGVVSGYPTLIERYKGAFDKLDCKGYLYKVSKKPFHNDKRLGLQGLEFITESKVKIVDYTAVKNIRAAIKDYFLMIPFNVAEFIKHDK